MRYTRVCVTLVTMPSRNRLLYTKLVNVTTHERNCGYSLARGADSTTATMTPTKRKANAAVLNNILAIL